MWKPFTQCDLESITTWQTTLQQNRWLSLSDRELGITESIREQFLNSYFKDLQRDFEDIHKLRYRATDVLDFKQDSKGVHFKESDSVTMHESTRDREYKRHLTLKDQPLCHLLASLVKISEPIHSLNSGKCAMHFSRTINVVTHTRHQDHIDVSAIYCLSVHGIGADTELTLNQDGSEPILKKRLNAGDIVLFEDSAFYHYTSPLTPSDSPSHREAIIFFIGNNKQIEQW